jgi:hypothetical protein
MYDSVKNITHFIPVDFEALGFQPAKPIGKSGIDFMGRY